MHTYKQDWLRTAVETEVNTTKAVDLNELLQGTGRAFVGVHTAAMLHLVASDDFGPLRHDTIPETLAMDLHRLSLLQQERKTLTTALSMLMSAGHELHKDAPALVDHIAKELSCCTLSAAHNNADLMLVNNANGESILETIDKLFSNADITPQAFLHDANRKRILMQRFKASAAPTDPLQALM
jgi:hypothetical protein